MAENAWLGGPDLTQDTSGAERADDGAAVLQWRLRDALVRPNPSLSDSTPDDAVCEVLRPPGATLEACNGAVYQLLMIPRGRRRDPGTHAKIIDFDDSGGNGWLAVDQFTVGENNV